VRQFGWAVAAEPSKGFRSSVDLVAHGRNSVRVYDLVDFAAVFGDHEMQVDRRERVSGDIEGCGAGAIRIYGIGAGTRRPFLHWGQAIGNDVVDLRDFPLPS